MTKPDGSKATSAKDKAQALNDFFTSVFTGENLHNVPSMPTTQVIEALSTIEITPYIVESKLDSLNPNKSLGQDGWHPHFMKELSDAIYIPLSILFTKSLNEGAHGKWRKAIITAIHKKGMKCLPENYRPISITSVISKLMESLVRDPIMDHLIKHKLLADDQHGFVPGRNCITQLLLCLEEWTKLVEEGEAFDVIYTDFSKAFDSVAHKRLLIKLERIGITGDLLRWIRSFLRNRTQCVNVEGVQSGWKDAMSGVPQGSVIGPILFVIFINDMPEEVLKSLCKLFADGCKLYRAVTANGANDLQLDMCNLEAWSDKWQLPFNATKCKVLHFGANDLRHPYMLNNPTLESTKSEKDLGIIIDEDMKYHVHTTSATKKSNQVFGIIKKSYVTRDANTIATLYKSMVRPHLEYGNIIWGPFYKMDMSRVESVQRLATKLVITLKNKSYEDRLIALDRPSLAYRRKRGDMIMMYKIVNELVRVDFNDLFTPIPTSHNLRCHNKRVFKHHATKHSRIDSFSQRVVNNWNTLPACVVNASSLNVFKNKLDEHWKYQRYALRDE